MERPIGPRSIVATAVVSGFLCACAGGAGSGEATVPQEYTIEYRASLKGEEFSVEAAPERIASVLPDVYERLGLPTAQASNTDELAFITPALRITGVLYEGSRNSEYLDCGRGFSTARADDPEIVLVFFVLTRIRPDGSGGSVVESIVDGHAENRFHSTNPVPCRGTGKLEAEIAGMIRLFVI